MRAEYDFSNARRGPLIPLTPGKLRVTVRLDEEVLDWFKDKVEAVGGSNYQTLINMALREHIRDADAHLEETIRRIAREEIRAAGGHPADGEAPASARKRTQNQAAMLAATAAPAPRPAKRAGSKVAGRGRAKAAAQ